MLTSYRYDASQRASIPLLIIEDQVVRVGEPLQAGSESLLVLRTFFRMREVYFPSGFDENAYRYDNRSLSLRLLLTTRTTEVISMALDTVQPRVSVPALAGRPSHRRYTTSRSSDQLPTSLLHYSSKMSIISPGWVYPSPAEANSSPNPTPSALLPRIFWESYINTSHNVSFFEDR